MKVHIEGDLYLSGDGRGFSLERKNVIKTGDNSGKEMFLPFAHYQTLPGAIRGLLKLYITETTAANLSELSKDILRIEGHIQTVCAGLEEKIKRTHVTSTEKVRKPRQKKAVTK